MTQLVQVRSVPGCPTEFVWERGINTNDLRSDLVRACSQACLQNARWVYRVRGWGLAARVLCVLGPRCSCPGGGARRCVDPVWGVVAFVLRAMERSRGWGPRRSRVVWTAVGCRAVCRVPSLQGLFGVCSASCRCVGFDR